MLKAYLLIAISAACAQQVDAVPTEISGMPVPPAQEDDNNDNLRRIENPVYLAEPSACALLPDDDSACAHACDPGTFEAFIPAGTCVTFDCPLADGTSIRTGGCRL